jgi:hypothetical protein
MSAAAAREIVLLRSAGTFPGGTNELLRLLPAAASGPIRAAGGRFNQRVTYRTNLVEIISDGHVDGSRVEARVRVVVVRSDTGALVASREFY